MTLEALRRHTHRVNTVLLAGMLAGGGHLPPRLESLVFYLVVFGVALIVHARNRVMNVLLACSTLFYLPAWFDAFQDAWFNILFCVSALLCLSYGIAATVRFVIKSREVSIEEVFALINCYLSLGFFWSLLYMLVEGFTPGSFSMALRQERLIDSMIYFSFCTMTTVGYGDMLPTSVLAQRLSITQAIVGQFYFALVVAYLLNKLFQPKAHSGDKQA